MRSSLLAVSLLGCLLSVSATADPIDQAPRADSHAPIGVMADHFHRQGEWMFSYRWMRMDMSGNRKGSDSISPEQIAVSEPNPFFGLPMQPPTLRVVPTSMVMDMHMFGMMYAPSDDLTLMLMAQYIDKEMDHLTFAGPAGTNVLGGFTTRSSGVGDTQASVLWRLAESDNDRWHAQLGLSLPTGDIENTDQVLAPTGMQPTLRLPYPMQLGSGTYDLIAGLTYARFFEDYSWGAQYRGVIRTGDNDENYTLGDEHALTGWASWLLANDWSWSLRLTANNRSNVDGMDPMIVAPVQTADPDRQGFQRLELGAGLNWAGQGPARGHRLGAEITTPIYQDLDGPQLEVNWNLTLGYQYAF